MNSILFAPIISLSTFMIPNSVDMNQAYIIDYEKKCWKDNAYPYELIRVKKNLEYLLSMNLYISNISNFFMNPWLKT